MLSYLILYVLRLLASGENIATKFEQKNFVPVLVLEKL